MRSLVLAGASLILVSASTAADAGCTKICDDIGCRFECADKFRIERIGNYFQFRIPNASPDQLKELGTQVSDSAIISAQRANDKLNIQITSVPRPNAIKILQSLAPDATEAELPQ